VWFGPRVGRQTSYFDALDDPLRRALGVDMGTASLMGWQGTTSSAGVFSFTGIAGIPGYRLSASAAGYRTASVEVPEDGQAAYIVLTPESAAHTGELAGRVVDPAGQGVARASVRLGGQVARTDEQGSFSIAIDSRAPGARMIALHPDWSPVLQPCLSASPSDPGAWPEPLVLKFLEPSPALEGVVIDESGSPVRGVEVRALDPMSWDECLGLLGEAPVRDGSRTDSVLGDGRVDTDENGRFRLRGLSSRSYHLRAADRRTLRIGLSEPIPAGTHDARIVLESASRPCTITGRVVDLRDQPIAGANVAARRFAPAAGSNTTEAIDGPGVKTDAEGRFQLAQVSCEAGALIVQPEAATPWKLVPLERGAAWDALVVKVGRTARVRVELQTQGLKADSVAFLDAHGNPLEVGAKRSRSGWISSSSMPLIEGKTEVLVVSEEAATLVLRLNRNEVQRLPVRLDPSETNVVKP
jgi:protocatechuate 3,4-dioxygenase beta subunit